jgi:hypothetical protein
LVVGFILNTPAISGEKKTRSGTTLAQLSLTALISGVTGALKSNGTSTPSWKRGTSETFQSVATMMAW